MVLRHKQLLDVLFSIVLRTIAPNEQLLPTALSCGPQIKQTSGLKCDWEASPRMPESDDQRLIM